MARLQFVLVGDRVKLTDLDDIHAHERRCATELKVKPIHYGERSVHCEMKRDETRGLVGPRTGGP
jgi:hypothetical protein